MGKYDKLGVSFVIIGACLSLIMHWFIKELDSFIHSGSFWLIGMPLIFSGVVLISINKAEDLKLRIWSKIIFSAIISIWIITVAIFIWLMKCKG